MTDSSDAIGPIRSAEDFIFESSTKMAADYRAAAEREADPQTAEFWRQHAEYFDASATYIKGTPPPMPPISPEKTIIPLRIISAADLVGEPPPRKWIVRDWLPCGVVTGIGANGSEGKTQIAQQLQTACAIGGLWLGLPAEQTPSLGIFCEDSTDELWRRQRDIARDYGVDPSELRDVHWVSRLGENNLLMTFTGNGTGELTTFHKQVAEAARDYKACVLVIDTAADTFGGNENDRNHVRQFVSRALGSIALAINGAVVLCMHPSRSGIASGQGDGGSTGWHNSLRSRLYLRSPAAEDGEKADPNARILERRKANYAARGDALHLVWRDGVIGPETPIEAGVTAAGRIGAEDVFLSLVREFADQGRTVSEVPNAGNYAPRVFGRLTRQLHHDFGKPEFVRAM